MKTAVTIFSVAISTMALAERATASYVFTISYAQGWSLGDSQGIVVRVPNMGAEYFGIFDAFNAGFTNIQIEAVANTNSTADSVGIKTDLGYGGENLVLPIVMKATGLWFTDVLLVDDGRSAFVFKSLDLGNSTMEISSAGEAIYDPVLRVTCDPAISGPMDLTMTMSNPASASVPEPSSLLCWGLLMLGFLGWRWRGLGRSVRQQA